MSGSHGVVTGSDVHTPFRWPEWANAAARAAETDIQSQDVGKIGLQIDNYSMWVLIDLTPTWTQIGQGGVTVEFTVGTQAGDVIAVDVQVQKNGVDVTEVYVLSAIITDVLPPDTGATPPNVGIAISPGILLHEFITDIYFSFATDETGLATIDIEDSGTPTFYLSVIMPDGTIESSGAITFV